MLKMNMRQAVNRLPISNRRAFMNWLTRRGPFWEDQRVHGPDDYLECNGEIVTDTAIGEAAFNCLRGLDYRLVSMAPSSWTFSPVSVRLCQNELEEDAIEVVNYWTSDELESALESEPVVMNTWDDVRELAENRFRNLTFTPECFAPIQGHPFVKSAAGRIVERLATLDTLKDCFDARGMRTTEGHRLIQDRFTGASAPFSDSSDTEKRKYRSELTFSAPDTGDSLFCTWHGKIRGRPPLRIHFTWPVAATSKLYVAYVGPKITRG